MAWNLEEYVEAQLTSFNDIVMNVDSVPLDRIELSGIMAAIKQWRGDGYPIAIGSISWSKIGASNEHFANFNQQAISGGWLPFNFGWKHDALKEYRLLKVQEGRKLLGGKKYSYRLYSCLDSGRFVFESSHRSSMLAMWELNKKLTESFGPINI